MSCGFLISTRGGSKKFAADEGKLEGEFIAFYLVDWVTLVGERTIRRGIWPFRYDEVVKEERREKSRNWVCSIRSSHILEMLPIEIAASAGEVGTADTVKQGSVHEHAVPEGETPQ